MTIIDWKKISHAAPLFFALALDPVSPTPVQAADYDIGSDFTISIKSIICRKVGH